MRNREKRIYNFVINKVILFFWENAGAITTWFQSLSLVFVGSDVILSLSLNELTGLLAHQFSHIKQYHCLKSAISYPIINTIGRSISPSILIPNLLHNYFNRHLITHADLNGAIVTKKPGAIGSGLEKIYDLKRIKHKYIMFFKEKIVEPFFWFLLSEPTLQTRITTLGK